ncbi:MAG: HAMP domain-containing histidine kinase [Spirochaetales bacterium]|nr:MAG: HAMP domain-containing histidine kinase [Spirochaetales bacterium]
MDVQTVEQTAFPLPDNSLEKVLSTIPVVVAVLDEDRQVVFGKEKLLDLVGRSTSLSGERAGLGDLVGCVNALASPDGCGSSEACVLCGVSCAIAESKQSGSAVTRECRIRHQSQGTYRALDVTVTASPYRSNGTPYTLLTVQDTSAEKRRRALERVFFHDIMNTASGVSGLAQILRDTDDPEQVREMLEVLGHSARNLLGEIESQRQLMAAENGDLKVEVATLDSGTILQAVADTLSYHDVAEGRRILIEPAGVSFTIRTDRVLLLRAMINLTKNALEAISPGDQVTLSAFRDNSGCWFVVHNPGYVERAVQLQLFQRSFSTKGEGRGLGTYGVQLIVGTYLRGAVSFESTQENGTTFRIHLLPDLTSQGKRDTI